MRDLLRFRRRSRLQWCGYRRIGCKILFGVSEHFDRVVGQMCHGRARSNNRISHRTLLSDHEWRWKEQIILALLCAGRTMNLEISKRSFRGRSTNTRGGERSRFIAANSKLCGKVLCGLRER
jgi:hypothetical protein